MNLLRVRKTPPADVTIQHSPQQEGINCLLLLSHASMAGGKLCAITACCVFLALAVFSPFCSGSCITMVRVKLRLPAIGLSRQSFSLLHILLLIFMDRSYRHSQCVDGEGFGGPFPAGDDVVLLALLGHDLQVALGLFADECQAPPGLNP